MCHRTRPQNTKFKLPRIVCQRIDRILEYPHQPPMITSSSTRPNDAKYRTKAEVNLRAIQITHVRRPPAIQINDLRLKSTALRQPQPHAYASRSAVRRGVLQKCGREKKSSSKHFPLARSLSLSLLGTTCTHTQPLLRCCPREGSRQQPKKSATEDRVYPKSVYARRRTLAKMKPPLASSCSRVD